MRGKIAAAIIICLLVNAFQGTDSRTTDQINQEISRGLEQATLNNNICPVLVLERVKNLNTRPPVTDQMKNLLVGYKETMQKIAMEENNGNENVANAKVEAILLSFALYDGLDSTCNQRVAVL